MISSALAMLLLLAAAASPRDAYNGCLKTLTRDNLDKKTAPEAFDQAVATACGAERIALRTAVIQRLTAAKTSPADAEESADGDIADYQDNAKEMYREYFESGTRPG